MRNHVASTLLLGLTLMGGAVSADDVYLQNGRKFEGVIAETTDTKVRIHMQGGVVTLPKSQVLRVDAKESDFSGYLKRKDALRRSDARAKDWLDLARWAKAQGMDQGAREAALMAAELDPGLEGVAPILRGYRYSFDEELGRWLSYEESMRRRGYVFTQGAWVSREELAERSRLRQEADAQEARQREAARAERTARQTEMILATQAALLEETIRDRQQDVYYPYGAYGSYYGWPAYVGTPGWFPQPCQHGGCNTPPGGGRPGVGHPGGGHHGGGHHGGGHHDGSAVPSTRSGFTRIPGSLIPGRYK